MIPARPMAPALHMLPATQIPPAMARRLAALGVSLAVPAQVDSGALFSIHPAMAAIAARAGSVVMEVVEATEEVGVTEVAEVVEAGTVVMIRCPARNRT